MRSERKTLLAVVAGALLSVLVGVTWLFRKRKNGEDSRKNIDSEQAL
jgi:LPXTG-motif cell wall-anchored protein